jgi:hypothetical protein
MGRKLIVYEPFVEMKNPCGKRASESAAASCLTYNQQSNRATVLTTLKGQKRVVM